jgi:hypothetical protein
VNALPWGVVEHVVCDESAWKATGNSLFTRLWIRSTREGRDGITTDRRSSKTLLRPTFNHMPTLSQATLRFVLCFLFCAAAVQLPATAKSKVPRPPPDPRILIIAVKPQTREIDIVYKRTGQKETYIVDDITEVTLVNSPGTFADIKVGQQIFSYVERDAHTLDSLTVGPADAAPVAPK